MPPTNEDWIFASPVQVGRLPYSYTGVKQELQRAADATSLGHLRSHAFRHTYRTWLDSVGTPATPDMREAHGKIVGLALNGTGTARKPA
jgi:integrase